LSGPRRAARIARSTCCAGGQAPMAISIAHPDRRYVRLPARAGRATLPPRRKGALVQGECARGRTEGWRKAALRCPGPAACRCRVLREPGNRCRPCRRGRQQQRAGLGRRLIIDDADRVWAAFRPRGGISRPVMRCSSGFSTGPELAAPGASLSAWSLQAHTLRTSVGLSTPVGTGSCSHAAEGVWRWRSRYR